MFNYIDQDKLKNLTAIETINQINLKNNNNETVNLHYYQFIPDSKCKSIIIAVHGLSEHVGWFQPILNKILEESSNHSPAFSSNFIVYDQRLHGSRMSKAKKLAGCTVQDMHQDLKEIIDYVKGLHPTKKLFLLGDSMGGLVINLTAVDKNYNLSDKVTGLIYENPITGLNDAMNKIMGQMDFFGKFFPNHFLPKFLVPDRTPFTTSIVEIQNKIKNDDDFRPSSTFAFLSNLFHSSEENYQQIMNDDETNVNFPSDLPYSFHLGTKDYMISMEHDKLFVEKTKKLNDKSMFFEYQGAKHCLKIESDEFQTAYLKNIEKFVSQFI